MSGLEFVPANDFTAQWREIRDAAHAALERVGESGWLILGQEVAAFEEALAPCFGARSAVGTGNGLDALEIALRATGLQPGDRVLTTPLSAFATTLAIVRAGGVPVFCDVDETGLLDLELAERALVASGARVLLPVHLYGHALDLERLAEVVARRRVTLIEDCAQSILAESRGVRAGSVGAMAATSFYPTKNLGALGDAGALVTSDDGLAAAARVLRDYGQTTKYVHARAGMNSRLDELQAAVLRSALLPRLEAWTQRRREVASAYLGGIRSARLVVPPQPPGSRSVHHLFPVLVDGEREAFLAHLKARGIAGGIHYPMLCSEQRALDGTKAEVVGGLDVARRFCTREVSLPIHPHLAEADVARVIDACNAW